MFDLDLLLGLLNHLSWFLSWVCGLWLLCLLIYLRLSYLWLNLFELLSWLVGLLRLVRVFNNLEVTEATHPGLPELILLDLLDVVFLDLSRR